MGFIGRFAKFQKAEWNWAEKTQGIENEWQSLEEDKEANIADRIDKLNALRFKIQSVNKNSPREKSDGILENEMPCIRNGAPEEET